MGVNIHGKAVIHMGDAVDHFITVLEQEYLAIHLAALLVESNESKSWSESGLSPHR